MKKTKPLTQKTIKLLRRIQKKILAEPKQFYMDSFFTSYTGWGIPNCGTAACIGGWAIALAANKNPLEARYLKTDDHLAARKVLGLTPPQAESLFYVEDWPREFRDKYESEISPKRMARVAVNRINYFIRTGV